MGSVIKNIKPSLNSRYQQGYVNTSACTKLFPSCKQERIIYRSSYEKKFIIWAENNPDVVHWGSECVEIPYFSRVDNKTHRYYPDFLLEFTDGTLMLVEIKPKNQTVKPVNESSYAAREYIRNKCKWAAALEWCRARGIKFKILTEKTIENM